MFFRSLIFSLIFFSINISSSINDYVYLFNDKSSFSNYSTIGIIQNPNSRFHEEGTLAFSWTHSDPYIKGSIIAYPFSWLEAAYHYTDINNALYSDVSAFSGGQSYKDKGFDIKLRMIKETRLIPQIAIGLRDFAGTDVFGAEFVTLSKNVQNFDFTLGFGFGGLSANSVSNPLKLIDDRLPSYAVKSSLITNLEFSILDAIEQLKLVKSRSEIKRLIKSNGIKVNNINYQENDFSLINYSNGSEIKISVGKKKIGVININKN